MRERYEVALSRLLVIAHSDLVIGEVEPECPQQLAVLERFAVLAAVPVGITGRR
ncbi:MAG: hypothetical protein ACT4PW_07325 [Acidimicrobiia bacterium]